MGPPDRPRRAHAPARRPRRRSPAAGRALPDRAARGPGNGRHRSRLCRAPNRPGPAGPAQRRPVDRRSVRPRRRLVPRPLAGPDRRAARPARHGDRRQQRLDRAARHVRRSAVPARRGRGGRNRSDPRRARTPPRRPDQGGPPRQPDRDVGRAARGDEPGRGAHLRRGEEHIRPPGALDARPTGGPRRRNVSHGHVGNPRRRAGRTPAHRPRRPGRGPGSRRLEGGGPGSPAVRRDGLPGWDANAGPGGDRRRGPV